MQVCKFGGTSMADHQTWMTVLQLISVMVEPVVVVSATARTTRELVQAAECAARGDTGQATTRVLGIQRRHLEIVRSFIHQMGLDGEEGRYQDDQPETHQPGTYQPETHQPETHQPNITEICTNFMEEMVTSLRKDLEIIAKQGFCTSELMDRIAGIGERISSFLLVECGRLKGLPLEFVDSRTIVKTDDTFGAAVPDEKRSAAGCKRLRKIVQSGKIPVLGGYIGEAPGGQPTTLGFEGSDVTATFLGGLMGVEKVTIWTDVDGIYSCDPRRVPAAVRLDQMTFEGAERMAKCGAKVLHPNTLQPVSERGIPVFVRNLFAPERGGTKIFGRMKVPGQWGFCAMAFVPEVLGVEGIGLDGPGAGGKTLGTGIAETWSGREGYRISVIGLMPERWGRIRQHVRRLVAGSAASAFATHSNRVDSSEAQPFSGTDSSLKSGTMAEAYPKVGPWTEPVACSGSGSFSESFVPGALPVYDESNTLLSLWVPAENFEENLKALYHLTCE